MRNTRSVNRRNKRSFTLLELIVCIGILALFITATGRYCKSGYDSWCYTKMNKRFQQKLEVAFALAKITDNPVDLLFYKKEQTLFFSMRPCQEVTKLLHDMVQKEEKLDAAQELLVDGKKERVLTIYPQGIRAAREVMLVPTSSTTPVPIDLAKNNLSMRCEEDETVVLQFFPEKELYPA